jgi:hypothetical protein
VLSLPETMPRRKAATQPLVPMSPCQHVPSWPSAALTFPQASGRFAPLHALRIFPPALVSSPHQKPLELSLTVSQIAFRCVGHLGMAEISLNGAQCAPFSFRRHHTGRRCDEAAATHVRSGMCSTDSASAWLGTRIGRPIAVKCYLENLGQKAGR